MFLGTLGASLLPSVIGNIFAGKGVTRAGEGVTVKDKVQLELGRIFNGASSFNKFWNTKVLSKRI